MEVIAHLECLVGLQTLECLVLSDLVQRGLLDGTSWNNLAVAIDLLNNVSKSIELGETLGWNFHFREKVRVNVDKVGGSFARDDHFIKFSRKNALNLVEEWSASYCQGFWKLRELFSFSSAPEKAFLCKANLSKIVNSNGDEVIG